jgi:hypothetical protein
MKFIIIYVVAIDWPFLSFIFGDVCPSVAYQQQLNLLSNLDKLGFEIIYKKIVTQSEFRERLLRISQIYVHR